MTCKSTGMTTNTATDSADARSSTLSEQPIAGDTLPAVEVMHAASEPDLESRVRERRAALIAKLGGLRGDLRPEAIESRQKLKAKLSDLAHIVKWGVVDDWASLSAPLTNTLEQWLAESARQLVTRSEQP